MLDQHCYQLSAEILLALTRVCIANTRPNNTTNTDFISPVLWSLLIPAIRLCRHLLRGVVSVHLQSVLAGTCRLCGSWSVAGHNHRKVIGQDPNCDDLHDMPTVGKH